MRNIEYEHNIIKQCFNNNNIFLDCLEKIETGSIFTDETVRDIWEVFTFISQSGVNLCLSSVKDAFYVAEREDMYEKFKEIIENHYTDEKEWDYHLNYIYEQYRLRELNKLADIIKRKITDECSDNLLKLAEEKCVQLDLKRQGEVHFRRAIEQAGESISKAHTGVSYVYNSGFEEMEKYISIPKGYQILCAAGAGVGKTSFMVQLARNLCEKNENMAILFFTMEMKAERIGRKFISNFCGLTEDKMLCKGDLKLDNDEMQKVKKAVLSFKSNQYNIEFIDRSLSIWSILNKVKRFARKYPEHNKVIILDNLGKVAKIDGTDGMAYQELISQKFLDIRDEYDTTNIILHHINKGDIKKDKNYRPSRTGVRGTGKLTDDADMVWLLHRPDYYDTLITENPDLEGKFVVIVDKNRDGLYDVDIVLNHKIEYSQFYDLTEEEHNIMEQKA